MTDRIDRLEQRLRQVLELLANAATAYTHIPSSQGDFIGNDKFIAPDLIGEANELLAEWDAEDADEPESPAPGGADGGRG